MAKSLINQRDSSSVSRFLEPGVARTAQNPVPSGKHDSGKQKATGETPNVKREFILTPSADEAMSEAVRLFSKATGTNLTNSHFLRVVLKVIDQAMPELKRETAKIGRLKRPSNARGKEAEREEYERRLAVALLAGMRASKPLG